jgi:hypothetical protein
LTVTIPTLFEPLFAHVATRGGYHSHPEAFHEDRWGSVRQDGRSDIVLVNSMQTNTRPLIPSLLLCSVLASCGAQMVQGYPGNPVDDVTYLITNPHATILVDRRYEVSADDRSKLQAISFAAGHHVIEMNCLYTKDVTYHPGKDGGPAPGTPLDTQQFAMSPAILLVTDGETGHRYKPRVHFTRNTDGLPGCNIKLFDVTQDSAGEKIHLY